MGSGHEMLFDLLGVRPNRYGLLLWLAEHLTAADIERLAEADAGFDLEDNRKALTKLLGNGELQGQVDVGQSWLQEVCSLLMWEAASGKLDVAEHRSVVLACTVLILAGAPGESLDGHVSSQSDPVATLVASVRHLGDEAHALAQAMLADGVQRFANTDSGEPDDLLCGLGIMALADHVPEGAFDWAMQLEQEWFAEDLGSDSAAWLWRLTFFDQSKGIWQRELLAAAERGDLGDEDEAGGGASARAKLAAAVRAWH